MVPTEGKSDKPEVSSKAPLFAPEDTPVLFFEDTSSVSASSSTVKFYLLRDDQTLDDESNAEKTSVVAQLVTTPNVFAVMSLNFMQIAIRMMKKDALSSEAATLLAEKIGELAEFARTD